MDTKVKLVISQIKKDFLNYFVFYIMVIHVFRVT